MAELLDSTGFAARLRALGVTPDARLAVAVSGGVDSITLAHLAWAAHPHDHLVFLTVDHRLRASATQEAAAVADTLRGWGAQCEVLTWHDAQAGTGVQERARTARYALLRASALARGCGGVLLGHHEDDQAETFWMRLADGSGLTGLGGMAGRREDDALAWLRPLLDVSRADIAAYAHHHALPVIEDPGNVNPAFTRVRLRALAHTLAQEGLDGARVAQAMAKLRAADDALRQVTQDFIRCTVRCHAGGALVLPVAAFAAQAPDVRRRVLQACLQVMTPRDYPPAYDAVMQLGARMAGEGASASSLAGCLVLQHRGDIWVLREPAAAAAVDLDGGVADALVWDHRFHIRGLQALGGQGLRLAALGEAGIAHLGMAKEKLLWPDAFTAVPAGVRRGVVALWQGENVLAVPQLSWQTAGFTGALPAVQAQISLGDIV